MIYLVSPYSHDDSLIRENRFRMACAAAAALMRDGISVFSPIAHIHPIALTGDLPLGWDFWEKYDREMIGSCDAVLVLKIEGWDKSRGVAAEIAIAEEMGKKVGFLRLEGDGIVFEESTK